MKPYPPYTAVGVRHGYAGARNIWDYFYIEGPYGVPLGEPEDILARLKKAFPELTYELELEEAPLHVPPGTLKYFIEWLRTRGGMGYPQYVGYFGCIGVFRFLAKPLVMRIEATFIVTSGADPDRAIQLEQLFDETGWIRKPFKPRRSLFALLGRR